jgi:hypothetical protein
MDYPRITDFTFNNSVEEYHTIAMLLGYKYLEYHHLFTKGGDTDHCLDPDTLARLPGSDSAYITRCRKVALLYRERGLKPPSSFGYCGDET